MPRADRVTLTKAGLEMPDVSDLSNKGFHNVLLDRSFGGQVLRQPRGKAKAPTWAEVYLFVNFTRLVDKALREYDASRAALSAYVAPPTDALSTGGYVISIDHMENSISATHRAVVLKQDLKDAGYGRAAPQLTVAQEERLRFLRNAFEHAGERILGTTNSSKIPRFQAGEPVALRMANQHVVIGDHAIRYAELVSHLRKLHATIEQIRGVATGTPGPAWPNARLRTDMGTRAGASTMRASDHLRELSRLIVSH